MDTPDTHHKSSRLVSGSPIFYGWVVLAAGTIGSVMMGPSQTFTVSIFVSWFMTDLGLSASTVSFIYGAASFGGAMLLPFTGRQFDRFGSRRMIIAVTIGLGLACLWMSVVQGVLMLFLGLLTLRFMGFGSMQLVSTNAVALWFIRRRGLVMGITGQSLGISLLIYPLLTEYLITEFGWRQAWLMLGLLVWAVMLPIGWLFFRDTPELYGLQPDGDAVIDEAHDPLAKPPEEHWRLAEARQTGIFWLFAIALASLAMLMAGMMFHQVSLFEVRGLSRSEAIIAFNVTALTSVIGNLGMGYLIYRYSARWLLTGVMLILMMAMILTQVMVAPWQAWLYGGLMGLTSSSFRVMDSVVWAKYFGRRYLGEIRGATMRGVVGSTALGPYLLGFSFDYLGGYWPMMVGLLLVPLTIAVLSPFTERPSK